MRLVVVLVLVTACVPYAVPPITADLGASRTTERGTRTGLHVNAGFSPMHFSQAQSRTRMWDATIGGSFDREANRDTWGASLAAGPVLYPWGREAKRTSVDRFLPQLVGRWTTDGTALGVRLALERAIFANGSGTGDGNGFAGYGEGAFGFYVEADLRRGDDMSHEREWAVTAGITLRSPAIAGVVCCLGL